MLVVVVAICKMGHTRACKVLFPDVQQTFSFTIDIILTEKYSGVYSPFIVIKYCLAHRIYRCETLTYSKAIDNKINYFEMWCYISVMDRDGWFGMCHEWSLIINTLL